MRSIRIILLGEFQCLKRDGQSSDITPAKDQGLITILALSEGYSCSRSKIIDLLWSTRGEDQAKASLRQSLWSLKKALGSSADELLQVDRKRISMNADEVETDIAEFQSLIDSADTDALEQAMTLYRGDLLEGLVIRDNEWEIWLGLERESLRASMAEVLNTLIDHYGAESSTRQLIGTGRRLVALDPFQEKGHRALMRGYAENNQKALALRQFGRCQELLQRELNTAPTAETLALFNRIQSGEIDAVLGDEPDSLVADTPVQTNKPGPEETAPGTITTRAEAERRQLTVMCCDLVDADALSQQLDAEDLLEINRIYQDICNSVISQYEGYVAQYLGHRLIAYFGYPQAHEDDAERAILAGLGITREINATRHDDLDITFAVRIGIATGAVVVGDLRGDTFSQERAVVGETPNLATRLLLLAEPNTVVIGSGTQALVTSRFEYEDLGDPESVSAWRVIVPVSAESRFAASHPGDLTPLVGREHEIALLLERWEQAKEGDGQVVLLSGEAGIGKSRVAETLKGRIDADDPFCLHYQCSPFHSNSYLYPVIDQLERAAQIDTGDTPELKCDKLKSLLAQDTPDIETVVTQFAFLLSIPSDKQEATAGISPDRQKELTLEALVAQMAIRSQQHPVLMIFEDTHWADPTSLELLELTIGKAQRLPVLVVMTFRPEFSPPWSEHTHITTLTLNRFTRSLAMAMVDQVTGEKSLPDEVQRHIIEKTDGVPLFVEELTKTLLESGLLKQDADRYTLSGSLSSLNIPATLQDSLMARLDRLATGKQVAQAGAAIGREFSRKLLESICGLPPAELNNSLDELVNSGLVFRQDSGPGTHFMFKHALVQEAAYASLLKKTRRILHGKIAEAMLELFPESTNSQPELLAHHYTEAKITKPALDYWLRAGERAVERCAYVEAKSHLQRGLALLETLPEGEPRIRREIRFRVALGVPLLRGTGATSPEVAENYSRAQGLCEELGETEQLFPVLWGLWYHHMNRFQLRRACGLADQLLEVGLQRNDEALRLEAHHCQWASRFLVGEPGAALEHAEQGMQLYRVEDHHALSFTYGGHDPGVCACDVSALALWLLGYPEQARERFDAAFDLVRKLGHPGTLANATSMWLLLSTFQRDKHAVEQHAETLLELAEVERGKIETLANATRGWAKFEEGKHDAGLGMMRESVKSQLLQDPWHAPLISLMAAALGQHGDVDEGMKLVEELLRLNQRDDVHWWEAELHRVKGELLLMDTPDDPGNAEGWFKQAIEIARAQSAKSLELRAAVSLARLWQDQGNSGEARDLLALVFEWFTEGFDTADLDDAKSLIGSLS